MARAITSSTWASPTSGATAIVSAHFHDSNQGRAGSSRGRSASILSAVSKHSPYRRVSRARTELGGVHRPPGRGAELLLPLGQGPHHLQEVLEGARVVPERAGEVDQRGHVEAALVLGTPCGVAPRRVLDDVGAPVLRRVVVGEPSPVVGVRRGREERPFERRSRRRGFAELRRAWRARTPAATRAGGSPRPVPPARIGVTSDLATSDSRRSDASSSSRSSSPPTIARVNGPAQMARYRKARCSSSSSRS